MPVAAAADSMKYKAESHQGAWREEKVELVSGAANAARTRTVGLTHTRRRIVVRFVA